MQFAIILLASAALLFSGAAASQTCDPADAPAEPPCPYGHWCPIDGVCPPNPCYAVTPEHPHGFPCVHGHCELSPPDDTTSTHTAHCVCDAKYHCFNDDCTVPNSCVTCQCDDCDGPGDKCHVSADGSDCQCEHPPPPPCPCTDCSDAGDKCIQDGPDEHGVPQCHCQRCDACPAHMHRDPTDADPCNCSCDANWCGPQCQSHSTCCDVSCSEHGHCIENSDPDGKGYCQCNYADQDIPGGPSGWPTNPAGLRPAFYGPHCEQMDQCREKNCGANGKCVNEPAAPDCDDCMTATCQCDKCFSGDTCQDAAPAAQCCDPATGESLDCGEHAERKVDADGNCYCECTDCWKQADGADPKAQCTVAPPTPPDNKCNGGGQCVDNDGTQCPLGATGCHWEPGNDVDCGHCGSCAESTGECNCAPGWSGLKCDVYNGCLVHNCGSHGHCHQGKLELDQCSAPLTCTCDPGFSGDDCEVDHCDGMRCGSHGRCVHTAEHWEPPSWTSPAGNPQNGQTISNNPEDPGPDPANPPAQLKGTCACTDGYTGDNCETPPTRSDPCQSDSAPTCGSHGRCIVGDDGSSTSCECDTGWCNANDECATDPSKCNCDLLKWHAAVSGGIITNPGSTSAGQRAAVGVVGMAAAAVIVKRRMALAVAPAGETIYAPQV